MVVRQVLRSLAVLLAMSSVAQAADLEPGVAVPAGGFYGNLQAGAFAGFSDLGTENGRIPGLLLGAKLAHDSADSDWGWQVDSQLSYVNFNWIKPTINDVDGHITTTDTAAHLTYRPDATSKLGLYAGYGTLTFGVEDSSGGTFDLLDDTGLTEASMTIGALGLGVEGLKELDDTTWMQGRVGLVDPIYISATLDDGITRRSDSRSDFLGDVLGFTTGGSLHKRLTDNITARAEVGYTLLGVNGAADIRHFSVGGGANYTLSEMPLSFGVAGAYNTLAVDGDSQGIFTANSKITYSFGGPSAGSTGKLFRSGAAGFNFN